MTRFSNHHYLPGLTVLEKSRPLTFQDPVQRALAYAPERDTEERRVYDSHINQFLDAMSSRTKREGWGRRKLVCFVMPMYLPPTFDQQFHEWLDQLGVPRQFKE